MYIRNDICVICGLSFIQTKITPEVLLLLLLLLLLSINASFFPEYCRIENYMQCTCVQVSNLPFTIKTLSRNVQLKQRSGNYGRLVFVRLWRKMSMEPGLTRVCGRLFHSPMVLRKKEYWYASNLVEGCRYPMLCPLVPDLDGMR